ncbi:hypothetical protein [Latilactobacillus phage TMW 1.1381 P1]|uniref:Uncharacterized protein n=1 Tax=Latilactobacillus curvatus TaxID=28038 RepID=A0A385AEV2_LATCU|nr:hypothetical protein [Latilactobacillus curvatus]WEU69639.1 hypothetical protein [Latilactobacillus phage TMW 1.1381 P1]AXN36180.1 hypothetical protein DT351_07280 [Latilactobacillus curvatus]MCT3525880.1 hypothetical protein [Latilactobacillus curvatus]UTB70151.1 hypothetical protein A4W71_03155 [Latilactobacillus curvatus]UTB74602.1 hypothetical protein A4W73_06945 [Latilactobacillus curvatus]
MAELTKIFTGMEKGPEAIQANFNLVKSDLMNSKLVDTGWVKVALENATGDVFIRKIGKHVMMRGSFKTTVNSSVTNQLSLVGSFPDEFKSTTSYSPIIELAGPWDPHYIMVQVACNSGKIAQIGGTQGTTVFIESIRWEVD